MKISIKKLVMLFLGLFLLKITVADPYRQNQDSTLKRNPAALSQMKTTVTSVKASY